MNIYQYAIEEAKDDIDNLCYNWNIIKLCYEMWHNQIVDSWGEDIKLHEIANVGVNYINEICACRVNKETCKRTFNASKSNEIFEYVRGVTIITEIVQLKEYIILNTVYNDLSNKKRRINSAKNKEEREKLQKRIKEIDKWIVRNYDKKTELKEYLKTLKKKIIKQIDSLPKVHANISGDGRYTAIGKIRRYLLGKTTDSMKQGEQYKYLLQTANLAIELRYETISKFSDEYLEVLHGNVSMVIDRINVERQYRLVRKVEKEFMEKALKGADEKYITEKD